MRLFSRAEKAGPTAAKSYYIGDFQLTVGDGALVVQRANPPRMEITADVFQVRICEEPTPPHRRYLEIQIEVEGLSTRGRLSIVSLDIAVPPVDFDTAYSLIRHLWETSGGPPSGRVRVDPNLDRSGQHTLGGETPEHDRPTHLDDKALAAAHGTVALTAGKSDPPSESKHRPLGPVEPVGLHQVLGSPEIFRSGPWVAFDYTGTLRSL